jgi:hypothetical protein
MKKTFCFAAIIGLALVPGLAFGQTQADQPATTAEPAATTTPLDQQPTKEQLAKLFEVMRLREQMQSVMKMMPALIQQQVQAQAKEMAPKLPGGGQLTPEQQAAFEKLMKNFMEKALNLYPADEMIADMASIYQRHMTREDVDAYIAFYGTPAGQHLLDLQPVIMKEYMPLVMNRMQERVKGLVEEQKKEMDEFMKSCEAPANTPAKK